MRVLQRWAGQENPLATLKLYEHTLHFRNGVALIDDLTEREINRLRAFGFRVERDTGPRPKPVAAPRAEAPGEATAGAEPVGPPKTAPRARRKGR